MAPTTEKASLAALIEICRKAAFSDIKFHLHDGECYVAPPTDDADFILKEANSTGTDILYVRTREGKKLGYFVLIWGNAPNGEELVADYGVNDFTESVWETHQALYA